MARPGSLLSSPQDASHGGGHAPTWAIWSAMWVVYIIWGSTYLAIAVVVETMPPFLAAGARFLVAGAMLYAWAIRRGDREGDRPTARQWRSAAIIGTALLLGGNGMVQWAEQTVPSGIAALLIATVPLWMAVMAGVVLRERMTWREVLGIAVGFGGVALLVGPVGGEARFDLLGIAAILFAALSWAGGSLYARRAPLPSRPLVGTAMEMLAGGVALVIVGLAAGELGRVDLGAFSVASWIGLAYLVVFGSLAGFAAYAWLLRVARTSLVSTYAYVNPVIAVLLGWAILSEAVTARTLIAGAVIVAAVALIVSARAEQGQDEPSGELGGPSVDPEDEQLSA